MMRFALYIILITLIAVGGYVFFSIPYSHVQEKTQSAQRVLPEVNTTTLQASLMAAATDTPRRVTLLAVGDIMLSRSVEALMEEEGLDYPFEGYRSELSTHDFTIGNFEGVVTEEHRNVKPMTFHFSVKDDYLRSLTNVGFDVVSLANNHALDYGSEELSYTRSLCMKSGLDCIGDPNNIPEYMLKVLEKNGIRIGIIALHTLYGAPSTTTLARALGELNTESDVQIAFVHWGDEYSTTHNSSQELFAQNLIDLGIDVVIGHHPHVVEDVGLYKGKAIIYSLGNFIFDQYFSTPVMEMLAVELAIDDAHIVIKFQPLTSEGTKAQPHTIKGSKAEIVKREILSSVRDDEHVNLRDGTITLDRD